MDAFVILDDTPIEAILDAVENTVTAKQKRHFILGFEKNGGNSRCKKIIHEIKMRYDVFIILKVKVPRHESLVEEYFSYGVHGIYFFHESGTYAEKQLDIMFFSTQIFRKGSVFADVADDKLLAEKMLHSKVIPMVVSGNEELITFIRNHSKYNEISSGLLEFIPSMEKQQSNYTLIDNIRMKMLLEIINMRQRLMVKEIEESFNSSGL